MNQLRCRSFIALVSLFGPGCATVTPPVSQTPVQLPAETSCRDIVAPDGKVQHFCGSAGQWAEFDRREALIQAGVTCRWANTPHELCLNASQWKTYDLRQQSASDAANMIRGKEAIVPNQNTSGGTLIGPVTMDPVSPGQ